MRKYGVTNVNDHFLSFNTICDATQVNFLALSLVHDIFFVLSLINIWTH